MVANKYFGGLIGRGGATRKAMCERSGARIFLSDPEECAQPRVPDAERPIYLYGTSDQIQAGISCINEEKAKVDMNGR
jgi:hypothetical protein